MIKEIKKVEEMGVNVLVDTTLQVYVRSCRNNCTKEMHERAMELRGELIRRLQELERLKKRTLLGRLFCSLGMHSYKYHGLIHKKCKRCYKVIQLKLNSYDLKGKKLGKGLIN